MLFTCVIFRVDYDRIKEVGPNKACAEWLLRCGASVKFRGFDKWSEDYNLLPTGSRDKIVIEQVDATDSCIMHIGFPHFGKGSRKLKCKVKTKARDLHG